MNRDQIGAVLFKVGIWMLILAFMSFALLTVAVFNIVMWKENWFAGLFSSWITLTLILIIVGKLIMKVENTDEL